MKSCDNCGQTIGKLETAFRWNGHSVCADWYARLQSSGRSVGMPTGGSNERTFLSAGDVVVTSSRVVIGDTTYALANITSVSVAPLMSGGQVLGAILMAFGGMIGLAMGSGLPETRTAMVILFLIFLLGLWVYRNSKMHFAVRVEGASGQANVLESADRGYVQSVADAVSQAIVHRGRS